MCITGNVVLYLPKGLQISGKGLIYIAPGGRLTVYLGAASQMAGLGTVNASGFATNCAYIGLPGCTKVLNSGKSDFIGTVYAPEAAVTLTGGGATGVNFVGAVAGNTVTVNGNVQFHYDQSLCGCATPVIRVPLADQTNCPATTAAFRVSVIGTGLGYNWYKNGSLLDTQAGNSLTLSNVSTNDAGIYSVVVSSACGYSVTNSAILTVIEATLITQPARSLTNCPGT